MLEEEGIEDGKTKKKGNKKKRKLKKWRNNGKDERKKFMEKS